MDRGKEVAILRGGLARVLPIVTLTAAVMASPVLALEVGQKAPDFVLNAPGGKQVKLTELLGKGPVVLYREDPVHVRRVARERSYLAPVLLDRSGEVTGRLYGVWGPPTVYVVDRSGRLVARAVGPRDWARPAVHQLLAALLDANP